MLWKSTAFVLKIEHDRCRGASVIIVFGIDTFNIIYGN